MNHFNQLLVSTKKLGVKDGPAEAARDKKKVTCSNYPCTYYLGSNLPMSQTKTPQLVVVNLEGTKALPYEICPLNGLACMDISN